MTRCSKCGAPTRRPVAAAVVDRTSGPSLLLWQCSLCYWSTCLDHVIGCERCRGLGGRCGTARLMWRRLAVARMADRR